MKKKNKVKRQSIIGEVVMEQPEAAEIMMEYGLHCVGCAVNVFETIEQGAKIHGLSDEKIQEMIRRLNRLLEEKDEDGNA